MWYIKPIMSAGEKDSFLLKNTPKTAEYGMIFGLSHNTHRRLFFVFSPCFSP
jgi:hypothetical protein